MIDVVFLLLVFFVLATRFGADAVLTLPLAAGGGEYTGPPRLVDIGESGVLLNGVAVRENRLAAQLDAMMQSSADTVILRGQQGTSIQRVIDITEILRQAGLTSLVLVE